MKSDIWDRGNMQGDSRKRMLLYAHYIIMGQEIAAMLHLGTEFKDVTVLDLLQELDRRILDLKQ